MSETTAPTLPDWATDETQVETPDPSKRLTGWDAAERPPMQYMNWLHLQAYKTLVYLKARLLATPGLQADTQLTIATGSITPTQGNHTVETEGAAGTDDLANIVTTNLDDGRLIIIRAANGAHDVVLKHAAGGAGQIHTSDGLDITLDDAVKMVTLKRVGADWYEVSRSWAVVTNGITGEVRMYAGSAAPSTWLFCDGAAVSRSTYATLYALVGTTYGVGDGSTTFNLPDFKGRTPIGVGTGSGLTARALAAKVGEETHVLTSAENAAHTHNSFASADASGSDSTPRLTNTGRLDILGGATPTSSSGSGTAHNNMQPSLAINFIIKY